MNEADVQRLADDIGELESNVVTASIQPLDDDSLGDKHISL